MESHEPFGSLNYAILFAYLALLFCIGVKSSGKQETTDDLFLAKRRMPWLAVGMSMFASMTSAISYMGIPGIAFKVNGSMIIAGVASPLVAPFLIFLFFPFYRRLHVTTSYEYIGMRFGRPGRYAIAILFLLARLGWLGVVLYAPAVALSVTCGLNLYLSIGLMGVVSIAYTAIGGLAAVIWTDVAQYLIMTLGAVCAAVALVISVPGGVGGIMGYAQAHHHMGDFSLHLRWFELTPMVVVLCLFFSMMQDYGTDQISVQRLLAVKSTRGVAWAVVFNSFTDLFMIALLVFIGLGMYAYYRMNIAHIPGNIPADSAFPYFIMHGLPPGVSGIVITAIYAASMSAVSAGVNSVVTVLVNDLIKPPRRTPRTGAQDLKLGRWLTLGMGVVITGIALYASTLDSLLKASQTFTGAFAAPILALFLLGMLTRRAHFRGWLAPAIMAAVATLLLPKLWFINDAWRFSLNRIEGAQQVQFYWYTPISLLISFVLGYIFSLFLPGPKGGAEYTLWGRRALEQRGPGSAFEARETAARGRTDFNPPR